MLDVRVVVYPQAGPDSVAATNPFTPASSLGATQDANDITDFIDQRISFATAAVGGFADCSFALDGDQRRYVPHLALVRVTLDDHLLYEGQIEDAHLEGSPGSYTTSVACFGLGRLLTEKSFRDTFLRRDMTWQPPAVGIGGSFQGSGLALTKGAAGSTSIATGRFDPTDFTRVGAKFLGGGQLLAAQAGDMVEWTTPAPFTKLLGTLTFAGANVTGAPSGMTARLMALIGSTWTDQGFFNVAGAFTSSFAAATGLRIGWSASNAGVTPTSADSIAWENLRILSAITSEDVSGGLYGGTILRNIVDSVRGLARGVIDDGSDFAIQTLYREVRDTCQSVIDEVVSYYTRRWAVWDGGKFHWTTRDLDQPDWICTLADFTSLQITGTLETIAKTVYVEYLDVAGRQQEASASSTAARNPYVKNGRAKDIIINSGFPMTPNTSQQLATRVVGDIGNYIPVQGSVTLPLSKIIERVGSGASPAVMIRANDNILIADLPKDDVFAQGRDGQTLFTVANTSCDLQAGTVTISLEGQAPNTDVILARLAAVTRTLSG